MPRILEQVRDWYASLEPRQSAMFWGVLGVVALVVIGTVSWTSSASYATVHRGDFEDVVRGSAALSEAGVPYRIEGNELKVPTDALGQAALAIRGANVVPSVDDAANLPMGMTPGQQKWAFLRAKEGDLAMMINDFSSITSSKVSIVPREQQVFFGEETEATASVLVKLRTGAQLDATQARAIVSLVSTAVDGLTPDGVTLTTTDGQLLHGGEPDKPFGEVVDGELLAYQGAIEASKAANVTAVLSRVFRDLGDFSVAVVADVDLTVTEVASTSYDPDSQVPLEVQSEDLAEEGGTPAGGVPGIDANTPEREATSGQGKASTSEKSRTREKFAYSRRDERTTSLAPALTRLSLAVQVNEVRLDELLGADATEEQVASFKASLVQAIQSAAGYDEGRGDVVSVTFLPFAPVEMVEGTATASTAAAVANYLPQAVGVLALVLVFLFVVRPLVGAVTAPTQAQSFGEDGLSANPALQDGEGNDLASRLRLMVENFEPVDARDLNRLVEQEAESAADVLRNWNKAG